MAWNFSIAFEGRALDQSCEPSRLGGVYRTIEPATDRPSIFVRQASESNRPRLALPATCRRREPLCCGVRHRCHRTRNLARRISESSAAPTCHRTDSIIICNPAGWTGRQREVQADACILRHESAFFSAMGYGVLRSIYSTRHCGILHNETGQ